MNKTDNKSDNAKNGRNRITVIVIAAAVIAAVAAAGLLLRFSGFEPVYTDYTGQAGAVSFENERMNEVLSTDKVSLLYDSKHGTVEFRSLENSSRFFPCTGTDSPLLDITLRDAGGNSYRLNSSANSALFGTFDSEKEKNSLKIIFSMYADEKSALTDSRSGVFAVVPLEFETENGRIRASVKLDEVELPDKFYIETLSLLPGLCNAAGADGSCRYVLPDGCGTVLDPARAGGDGVEGELSVYGNDLIYETPGASALLPYYSYFDGRTLLTVIIDGGDALAKIRYSAKGEGAPAFVNSSFTVTPVLEGEKKYSHGVSYSGEASLLLDFSAEKAVDYCDIAFTLRDVFVKKGYLADNSEKTVGDLPFLITAIGSLDGKNESVLTDFDGAAEMLALLNSKGVRRMNLRYTGALDGGLTQKAVSTVGVSSALGGSDGLSSLVKTARNKKSEVFLEADVTAGGSAIKRADGYIAGSALYGELYAAAGAAPVSVRAASLKTVKKNISALCALSSQLENCCVCVNGITQSLCSDKSAGLDRCAAAAELSKNISSLAACSEVMLSDVMLPLMREASFVARVPDSSSLSASGCAEDVPVLQIVLHGSVGYGGSFIDFSDGWQGILKSIEYGASPSFLFTYNECADLAYADYASLTAKYYSKVKGLKAVTDMQITSHEQRVPGVYKIVYGYNKTVYVNYNKSVVTVDGLLLSPMDFVLL